MHQHAVLSRAWVQLLSQDEVNATFAIQFDLALLISAICRYDTHAEPVSGVGQPGLQRPWET